MVGILNVRAPKAGGSFDRQLSIADAIGKLPELRARYGVTRVGDITRLDRIGIPVVTAIVPRSPDALGVYNGKGRTLEEATIGAVMEACERQIAAAFSPQTYALPAREIHEYLDLRLLELFPVLWSSALDCVDGVNLLNGATIPVPLALITTPWRRSPVFTGTHTSGLASGGTLLEATYHALLELLERHAWSLAHLRARVLPARLIAPRTLEADLPAGETIVRPTHDDDVDALCERIERAGLEIGLILLREPGFPYTVHATVGDPDDARLAAAIGLGASWSPRHAAIRAITEAVQSRVVEIQAAREDIARRNEKPVRKQWFAGVAPASRVAMRDLRDDASPDLADDLRAALDALREAGVRCVAAVELPAESMYVARVIVPELESYLVDRRIGAFARRELTALAARLSSYI